MVLQSTIVAVAALAIGSSASFVPDQIVAPISSAVGGAPCNHSDYIMKNCFTQVGAPEVCADMVQTHPGWDPQVWLDVELKKEPICTNNFCTNFIWWKRQAGACEESQKNE